MLPRPRLVCQEPGLRPIGRSPGVPDKSSRGLGSMSRYSAQILISFIAYIFSIFNFSVGLVGNLAELPPCTVPPATVHCCSGSLEPESSCHDRDWTMELPMEADILTFTGILPPGDASVASSFPFDITISLSWFPLLSIPPLHSAIP